MLIQILQILVWVIALTIGSFVFWLRLEKDYSGEVIWIVLCKITVWAFAFSRLAWFAWQIPSSHISLSWLWDIGNHSGLDILGGLAGATMALYFTDDFKRPLNSELGDALIEAYAWFLYLLFIGTSLISPSAQILHKSIIFTISIILAYLIKFNYRKWSWYHSGKVGFIFWAFIIILSISLTVTELSNMNTSLNTARNMYFFVPVVIGIINIYILSGRKFKTDQIQFLRKIKLSIVVLKQKLRKKSINKHYHAQH